MQQGKTLWTERTLWHMAEKGAEEWRARAVLFHFQATVNIKPTARGEKILHEAVNVQKLKSWGGAT